MSRIRYLQLCTIAPAVVALLCGVAHYTILWVAGPMAGPIHGHSLFGVFLWLLLALPFMGFLLVAPAYIAFAATVLFFLRGRPERAYRRSALAAPPVFTAVTIAYFFALSLGRANLWGLVAIAIPYSLILGYASVAVTLLGLRILSARGWLASLNGAA